MIGPSRAFLAAAIVAAAVSAPANAATTPKAEKAAIDHARTALAAKLGAVRLTPKVTVAQCLKFNRRIASDVDAHLAKIRPTGKPRWYADGSCEVDMQVAVAACLTVLRNAVQRHYLGTRITPADIDAKIAATGDTIIRVVGSALGEPATVAAPVNRPLIWSRYSSPEAAAKAETAAIADAHRKLMRKVQQLRLADGVTVADLTAANDEIREGLTRYLAKLQIKGRPSYRSRELIVDVTLEVAAREVAEQLKVLYLAHGDGEAVKAADFDKLAKAPAKRLRAVGNGAPPEQLTPPPASAVAAALRRPKWPKVLRTTAAAEVDRSAVNVGQSKLRAMRQAEQAARAKLAKQAEGLRVTAELTVRQFAVAAGPGALADIKTYLSGASVTRSQVSQKGQAQAVVELGSDRLWKIVTFWHQRRNGR